MSGTNLSGARDWTVRQLRQAKSLAGATMPDGTTLQADDNLNGPTFEEWAESQLQAEDEVDQRAVEKARRIAAVDGALTAVDTLHEEEE